MGELARNPCALLPWGRYPVRGRSALRPFFIVGCGRRGNTLLRRILTAHPDLHIPPESGGIAGSLLGPYREMRRAHWDNLVHMLIGRMATTPDIAHFGTDFHALAGELAALPRPRRTLADVLDIVYRRHAASQGKARARWGDKTPINHAWLAEIRDIFPGAQFIHVLRDPLDVAASYVRMERRFAHSAPPGASRAVQAAMRWVDAVGAIRRERSRRPDQWREVRYVDLVREPERVARELCAFLEVPFDPAMLSGEPDAEAMGDVAAYPHHANVPGPIRTDRIGAGARELSGEDRAEVIRITGPLAREAFPEGGTAGEGEA